MALDCPSGGCEGPRRARGVDHVGPWWTRFLMKKLAFIRKNLSNVRVIIVIMRVPVEELRCQAVIGWTLVLKHLLSNACGHVLSCKALKVAASWGPDSSDFTRYWKSPRHYCQEPGYVPSRITRRIYIGQTSAKILSVCGYRDGRENWYESFQSLVPFRLVAHPLQLGVVRPDLIHGAWFPSCLPLEETYLLRCPPTWSDHREWSDALR
jgi:hypothetical protein